MNRTLIQSIPGRSARWMAPAASLLLAATAEARWSSPSEEPETIPGSSWYARVCGEISRGEYTFQPLGAEPGVWSAPNRSQELRTRASVRGLEVFPRPTSAEDRCAPWKLTLTTKRFGRLGELRELPPATISIQENWVELEHGLLREWLENREAGLEHGWTIEERPSGVEPLWIDVELGGELFICIGDTGLSGELVDASGEVQLRYGGLAAFDASGRRIPARMEASASGVGIQVDDAGAVYPLTVDPVLEGPAWTRESNQVNANYGQSVAAAGDVNHDGYGDVIVGAPYYDAGQVDEGRVWLYLGSATGLGSTAWTVASDQAGAHFGRCVAAAGDVDGDGYDDVIVGAPDFDNPEVDEGRAWLYLGSDAPFGLPAWSADSDQDFALYGLRAAAAGDVDGDGYDDVIVAAPFYDDPEVNEGRVWLYLGSPGGLGSSAWTAESDQAGALYGFALAGAGDTDADGYDDVIIAAPEYDNPEINEGMVWFYRGNAGGLSGSAWIRDSDQAHANFGEALSAAGDVDHDGFGDVILAAPYYDNPEIDEGRVWVYVGSSLGLTISTWDSDSDQASAFYGYSVAAAGDVNADGFADLIVGAPYFDNPEVDEGRAWVYLGSPAGPIALAAWRGDVNVVAAHYGSCVASAGDVNADGASDVIVGAPSYDHGQANEGGAFVYHGVGSPGTKYCTATSNSTGAPADISSSGSAFAGAGDLTLEAAPVPNQPGLFFHAANQSQIPFGNGFLCATNDIVRGVVIAAVGNLAAYTYDNSDPRHSLGAYAFTNRNFQYWFRDPLGGGAFFNTSNAIAITLFP